MGALQPRFQNEKQNCTDKSGLAEGRKHRGSLWIYSSWLVGWLVSALIYLCVCFGCYPLHSIKQHGKPVS